MNYSELSSMSDMATSLSYEIHRNMEQQILSQLDDFVSRGLIELVHEKPILVCSPHGPDKLEVKTKVKLVIKDKKYIEELEAKVNDYELMINRIRESKII